MRYGTLDALQGLIGHRVPEGPTIEYKRELNLIGRDQRREALKDLTGMANGRGGTVIYGLDESLDEYPVPTTMTPLGDFGLVGILEDLVRQGVRPPLLLELATVEHPDGGYILVADVQQSPLGPYMVELYGTYRYFLRSGRSTAPMTEQQVRDAYAIAERVRDRRPQIWADHSLPIAPLNADSPFISVSALPEEPLAEIIDLASVSPDSLTPDGPLLKYLQITELHTAFYYVTRWAFGLLGSDSNGERPATTFVRVHLDGAVGMTSDLYTELWPLTAARALNAELLFTSWIWGRLDLRRPVEMRLRIDNLANCSLGTYSRFGESSRLVREPPGVPIHHLELADVILPSDLRSAATRHGLVRRLVNRLNHAFGEPDNYMFRGGQLYGRHGGPDGMALSGGGLWDDSGKRYGVVYTDNSIRHPDSGNVIAFNLGGAILDSAGSTVAVLEFAEGSGYPDEFILTTLRQDPRARVPGGNAGVAGTAEVPATAPVATGKWADKTLAELVG